MNSPSHQHNSNDNLGHEETHPTNRTNAHDESATVQQDDDIGNINLPNYKDQTRLYQRFESNNNVVHEFHTDINNNNSMDGRNWPNYKDQSRHQQRLDANGSPSTVPNEIQDGNHDDSITDNNNNELNYKDQTRGQQRQLVNTTDTQEIHTERNDENRIDATNWPNYKDQSRNQKILESSAVSFTTSTTRVISPNRPTTQNEYSNTLIQPDANTSVSSGTNESVSPNPTNIELNEGSNRMGDTEPIQAMIIVTAEEMNDSEVEDTSEYFVQSVSTNEHVDNVGNLSINRSEENAPSQVLENERNKKRNMWKTYFATGLGILLAIGLGTYLLIRQTRQKSDIFPTTNSPTTSTTPSAIPTSTPTVSPAPTILRKKFKDRSELVTAVDNYFEPTTIDSVLNSYGPIENWDVSNVTEFYELFSADRIPQAADFNADLSKWNVSSATDLRVMFNGATKFNADLSKWDVSSVLYFGYMFKSATNFQSDLSRWDVSSALELSSIFDSAENFQSDLSNWDVSSATMLDGLFIGNKNFNSDLSRWDVSRAEGFSDIFSGATNFTSDLSKWNMSSAMYLYCFACQTKYFDTDVSKWDTSRVGMFESMFESAESFTGTGIDQWDVSYGYAFDSAFKGAVSFDADLSQWNTSGATSMTLMFAQATSFKGKGVENWDVSKVQRMGSMFEKAVKFNANLSNWNTSMLFDMSNMFAQTSKFQGTGLNFWEINDLAYMDGMFCDATALNQSYISEWDLTRNQTLCE